MEATIEDHFTEDIFTAKTKSPGFGIQTIGIVLLVLAIIVFFNRLSHRDIGGMLGCLLLFALIYRFLYYEGIVIDFNKQQYLPHWGCLWFRFGQWQTLPQLTNIVLFSVKHKIKSNRGWTTTAYTETIYRTTLYNPTTDAAIVINNTMNKKEAIRKAEQLAKRLKMRLEIEIDE